MKACNFSFKKGLTLVEVLITCSIMAIFLLMSSSLLVSGYRYNVMSESKDVLTTQAFLAIHYLGRELQLANGLVNPKLFFWSVGTSYSPEYSKNPPFIFRRYSPHFQRDIVVAYEWNSQKMSLERFLYPTGYTTYIPNSSEQSGTRKVVCTNVVNFQISRTSVPTLSIPHFFQIELVVADKGEKIPLDLQVWVKDL